LYTLGNQTVAAEGTNFLGYATLYKRPSRRERIHSSVTVEDRLDEKTVAVCPEWNEPEAEILKEMSVDPVMKCRTRCY
jgi:hypothetical protein